MISSNTQKSLFTAILAILLCISCKSWQSFDNTADQDPDSEIQTNIPFSTKEPDTFQMEIIVSNFNSGKKNELKHFVAKDGIKYLQRLNVGSNSERSLLKTADNKTYLINPRTKSFSELSSKRSDELADESFIKSLTSKWLNEKTSATFERLETENGLTKYRINLEDAKNSEVYVTVDEKLQMPVKQEFYNLSENKKSLTYLMEIKNYKTSVENDLFKLPYEYTKTE